jgi:MoxR-like ATPase
MYTVVDYPNKDEERKILDLDEARRKANTPPAPLPSTTQAEVLSARAKSAEIYVDEKLKTYIVSLVTATRNPKPYSEKLARWIKHGASPRATLAILRCAKAYAWLRGDEYVSPDHIHTVAPDILRHRIIPSFEAEADNMSRGGIVSQLLDVVAVP